MVPGPVSQAPGRARSDSALVGLLTSLGPLGPLVALLVDGPRYLGEVLGVSVLASELLFGALGAGTLLSGLLLSRRPVLARRLAVGSLASLAALMLPGLMLDPRLTLVTLVGVGVLITWSLRPDAEIFTRPGSAVPMDPQHPRRVLGAVWTSSAGALLGWLAVAAEQATNSWEALVLGFAAFAVATAHGLRWAARALRRPSAGARAWYALPLVGTAVAVAGIDDASVALSGLALQQVALLFLAARRHRTTVDWLGGLAAQPARLLVSTFAGLGVVGGVVLTFPISTAPGQSLSLLDGWFTATSASCVTGLVVVDTPTFFSRFGQVVVLLLIQVGGLGIMTFSAAATLFLGRRLGLVAEASIQGLVADGTRVNLERLLRRILLVTFASEGLGALLLAGAFFQAGDSAGDALWRGVFTSISAFCNAGFALQTDSLISYQENPFVLHVVAALIALGGLGTVVVVSLPALALRRLVPLSVRLVVVTTVLLLVLPAAFILLSEWSGALGGLSVTDKVHNAWFQSVTLRTAGFNSIDLMATNDATRTLMIAMMFVGGSPASTAGGIKTTTLAVLVLVVAAELRGRPAVVAFNRRVGAATIQRAAAVAGIAVFVVLCATTALQLTQPPSRDGLLFEAVSALGTVGLSLNVTPALDGVGKVIVGICMFLGRVGPLSLFMLLSAPRRGDRWELPEESLNLG